MDDITQPGTVVPPLPSGRFLLRLSPQLHAGLRDSAAEAGLSLNEFCVRKLSGPGIDGGPGEAAVGWALDRLGSALVGVVAYGSWARGELADGSDLDLLMVVSDGVALTRDVYREWDSAMLELEGRPVELHFARQPDLGARLSSFWAEVAVDGVVLFERGHDLSKRLAEIRRRIVDERWVRRRVHGQPYWVEAA